MLKFTKTYSSHFKDFDDRKSAKSFINELHNSGHEVLSIIESSFTYYLFKDGEDNE